MMKQPVIIWGGVDVNPIYYQQKPLKWTQTPNKQRDAAEFARVLNAKEHKIPVIGVCRGAQLLCVANGGSLYQHSEPHIQAHSIQTSDGNYFDTVLAGHHQIMRPVGDDFLILGWNPSTVEVWTADDESHVLKNTPEVVYYPEFNHLAIQPHPEWASKGDKFVEWINELLRKFEIAYEF